MYQEQRNCLSVREISSRIAMILRGSLSSIEHGNNIMLSDTEHDCYVLVSIREATTLETRYDLFLESGCISMKTVYSKVVLRGIEHLYVTLDIPHLSAFCYIHSGRYYIFDVNANATIKGTSDIDRRQNETVPVDPEILNKRRSFFHIGIVELEPEEEEEPPEETEAEEKKDEETEEAVSGSKETGLISMVNKKTGKVIKG